MRKEHAAIWKVASTAEEAIKFALYNACFGAKKYVKICSDMSETCHPGIAYILQLYTEEQSRVDTALTHNVCHTSKEDGMRGMELPYQLRSDWMVTSVLFLCFILVSYVLAHGKKHLEQQFKNFALSKSVPVCLMILLHLMCVIHWC